MSFLFYIFTGHKLISQMNLSDLIAKNRTYRRFDESYRFEYKALEQLVNLARLSASAANKQPLKFLLYNTPKECERVFPFLAWAGYLKD